eukprot:1713640-Pyramimonas_sp.AAC.1
MAKPSAEGGMSAVRVDRAELLARRGITATCLMERSAYLEDLAERDLRRTIWAMRKSGKRRGS